MSLYGIMSDAGVCHLCGTKLNDPLRPLSEDCGGDCLECMAEERDPQALARMRELGLTIKDEGDE